MQYWIVIVLLMFSAMALPGQVDEPSGALTIYTRFVQSPSNSSIVYMKDEMDAIMLPFHLRVQWRTLDGEQGSEPVAAVMVVTFKGQCRTDTLPWLRPAGTLGWTHISDGEILPFADVDCDRIRDLMAEALAVSSPVSRERLLGHAMARVLAHESYHVLANTTHHASCGIAKARYTGAELASARMRFDEAQLRTAMAHRQAGMHTSNAAGCE